MSRVGIAQFLWTRGIVIIAALVSITVAAFGVMAQTSSRAPKSIETESLVIRDKSGNVRAALGAWADGSVNLILYDKSRTARLGLSVKPDGSPRVSLTDGKQPQIEIGFWTANGVTGINLSDADGRHRLLIAVAKEGAPTLGLRDKDERPRLALNVLPDGVASIALLDKAQRRRLWLATADEGLSAVRIIDDQGGTIWGSP